MQTRTEDHFDEPEKQRIIALAAQLQREAETRLTAADLEAAALEGGIDPKYVQAAIEQVRTEQARPEPVHAPLTEPVAVRSGSPLPAAVLVALTFGQIYGISGEIFGSSRDYYIPIALAALAAVLWCPRRFWKGLAAYLVITFAVVVGVRIVTIIPGSVLDDNWLRYVENLVAIQIFAYLAGALLRRLVDSATKSRPVQIPTEIRP